MFPYENLSTRQRNHFELRLHYTMGFAHETHWYDIFDEKYNFICREIRIKNSA